MYSNDIPEKYLDILRRKENREFFEWFILLHDIGKLETQAENINSRDVTNYGHAEKSVEIIKKYKLAQNFPNRELLIKIIGFHMLLGYDMEKVLFSNLNDDEMDLYVCCLFLDVAWRNSANTLYKQDTDKIKEFLEKLQKIRKIEEELESQKVDIIKRKQIHVGKVVESMKMLMSGDITSLLDRIDSGKNKKKLENILKDFYNDYEHLPDEAKSVLQVSIILHDIGAVEGERDWTHNDLGSKKVKDILPRLGYDDKFVNEVSKLIYNHGFVANMGVDFLPEDLKSMSEVELKMLGIVALCDLTGRQDGKIYSETIKDLKDQEDELISIKNNIIDPLVYPSKPFLNDRLGAIFSPVLLTKKKDKFMNFNGLSSELDKRGFLTKEFIRNWSEKIRVLCFPLLRGIADSEGSYASLAKLLYLVEVALEKYENSHVLQSGSKVFLDTDIDHAGLPKAEKVTYIKPFMEILKNNKRVDIKTEEKNGDVYITIVINKELMNREGYMNAPVIIVAGLTGSGKTKFINQLMSASDKFVFPMLTTTRSPRQGEVNGKDRIFVSLEEFKKLESDGMLLSVRENHGDGQWYGIDKQELARCYKQGSAILFDTTSLDSLKSIKSVFPQAQTLLISPIEYKQFITGNSGELVETIKNRLEKRDGINAADTAKRLEEVKASADTFSAYPFDYIIDDAKDKSFASEKFSKLYDPEFRRSTLPIEIKSPDGVDLFGRIYEKRIQRLYDIAKRLFQESMYDRSLKYFYKVLTLFYFTKAHDIRLSAKFEDIRPKAESKMKDIQLGKVKSESSEILQTVDPVNGEIIPMMEGVKWIDGHTREFWHGNTQILIINSEGKVMMRVRPEDGKQDVSATGHLYFKENFEGSALRIIGTKLHIAGVLPEKIYPVNAEHGIRKVGLSTYEGKPHLEQIGLADQAPVTNGNTQKYDALLCPARTRMNYEYDKFYIYMLDDEEVARLRANPDSEVFKYNFRNIEDIVRDVNASGEKWNEYSSQVLQLFMKFSGDKDNIMSVKKSIYEYITGYIDRMGEIIVPGERIKIDVSYLDRLHETARKLIEQIYENPKEQYNKKREADRAYNKAVVVLAWNRLKELAGGGGLLSKEKVDEFVTLLERFAGDAGSDYGRAAMYLLAGNENVDLKVDSENKKYVFAKKDGEIISGIFIDFDRAVIMSERLKNGINTIRKGAIAADMDKTLALYNQDVDEEVSNYVNLFRILGIHFSVVSGNEFNLQLGRQAVQFIPDVLLEGFSIYANGAGLKVVFDRYGGNSEDKTYTKNIDENSVRATEEILNRVKKIFRVFLRAVIANQQELRDKNTRDEAVIKILAFMEKRSKEFDADTWEKFKLDYDAMIGSVINVLDGNEKNKKAADKFNEILLLNAHAIDTMDRVYDKDKEKMNPQEKDFVKKEKWPFIDKRKNRDGSRIIQLTLKPLVPTGIRAKLSGIIESSVSEAAIDGLRITSGGSTSTDITSQAANKCSAADDLKAELGLTKSEAGLVVAIDDEMGAKQVGFPFLKSKGITVISTERPESIDQKDEKNGGARKYSEEESKLINARWYWAQSNFGKSEVEATKAIFKSITDTYKQEADRLMIGGDDKVTPALKLFKTRYLIKNIQPRDRPGSVITNRREAGKTSASLFDIDIWRMVGDALSLKLGIDSPLAQEVLNYVSGKAFIGIAHNLAVKAVTALDRNIEPDVELTNAVLSDPLLSELKGKVAIDTMNSPPLVAMAHGQNSEDIFSFQSVTYSKDNNGVLHVILPKEFKEKYSDKLIEAARLAVIHEYLESTGKTHDEVVKAGFGSELLDLPKEELQKAIIQSCKNTNLVSIVRGMSDYKVTSKSMDYNENMDKYFDGYAKNTEGAIKDLGNGNFIRSGADKIRKREETHENVYVAVPLDHSQKVKDIVSEVNNIIRNVLKDKTIPDENGITDNAQYMPKEQVHSTQAAIPSSDKLSGDQKNGYFKTFNSMFKDEQINRWTYEIAGAYLMPDFAVVLKLRTKTGQVEQIREISENNGFKRLSISHVSVCYINSATAEQLRELNGRLNDFNHELQTKDIKERTVETEQIALYNQINKMVQKRRSDDHVMLGHGDEFNENINGSFVTSKRRENEEKQAGSYVSYINWQLVSKSDLRKAVEQFGIDTADENGNRHMNIYLVGEMPENPEVMGLKNTGILVNGKPVWASTKSGALILFAQGERADTVAKVISKTVTNNGNMNGSRKAAERFKGFFKELNIDVGTNGFKPGITIDHTSTGKKIAYNEQGSMVVTADMFMDKEGNINSDTISTRLDELMTIRNAESVAMPQNIYINLDGLANIKEFMANLEVFNKAGNGQMIVDPSIFKDMSVTQIKNIAELARKSGVKICVDLKNDVSRRRYYMGLGFPGYVLNVNNETRVYEFVSGYSGIKADVISGYENAEQLKSRISGSRASCKILNLSELKSLLKGGERSIIDRVALTELLKTTILSLYSTNTLTKEFVCGVGHSWDRDKLPDSHFDSGILAETVNKGNVGQILEAMNIKNVSHSVNTYLEKIRNELKGTENEPRLQDIQRAFLTSIAEKMLAKAELDRAGKSNGLADQELEIILGQKLLERKIIHTEDKGILLTPEMFMLQNKVDAAMFYSKLDLKIKELCGLTDPAAINAIVVLIPQLGEPKIVEQLKKKEVLFDENSLKEVLQAA
jgi:guanylate kinase